MTNKYDKMYMDIVDRVSQESKCPRKQVGCVFLLESGMISLGFNGHASGGPNEWEWQENGNDEVVHSEFNCLSKLLEQGVSAKGAIVYLSLSPCLPCSKLLVGAKVKCVIYKEEYRDKHGLEYLQKYGVQVERWNPSCDSYVGHNEQTGCYCC